MHKTQTTTDDASNQMNSSEEEILCEECDTPIPPKRYALVRVKICVDCMSEKEKRGQGTVKTKMFQEFYGSEDDIEDVQTFLVRGKS